jgi:hypothetical protein
MPTGCRLQARRRSISLPAAAAGRRRPPARPPAPPAPCRGCPLAGARAAGRPRPFCGRAWAPRAASAARAAAWPAAAAPDDPPSCPRRARRAWLLWPHGARPFLRPARGARATRRGPRAAAPQPPPARGARPPRQPHSARGARARARTRTTANEPRRPRPLLAAPQERSHCRRRPRAGALRARARARRPARARARHMAGRAWSTHARRTSHPTPLAVVIAPRLCAALRPTLGAGAPAGLLPRPLLLPCFALLCSAPPSSRKPYAPQALPWRQALSPYCDRAGRRSPPPRYPPSNPSQRQVLTPPQRPSVRVPEATQSPLSTQPSSTQDSAFAKSRFDRVRASSTPPGRAGRAPRHPRPH